MKLKTKWKRILILTLSILMGTTLLGMGKVEAVLQANSITHDAKKTDTGANWMQKIREMETEGQTMGLNETLNTDLSPKTSNNIDIHMMRTTEYGAIAILSASGFGNPKKISEVDIKSSTGNVTGVYINISKREWTAGVCSVSTVGTGVNARYYDLYTINDQTSAKIGDALGKDSYKDNPGCSGWHGCFASWIDRDDRGFVRGKDGIFTFLGHGTNSYSEAGWAKSTNCGRGVAVVGQGF